jgi:outer membrane lipoprotein SlyB
MKKNLIYSASAIILASIMMSSCYTYTSPMSYGGTATGASIGGFLGSTLGAATTNGSFGGSLVGNIVGSAAGAALGNKVSKSAEQRRLQKRQERQNRRNQANAQQVQQDDYSYDTPESNDVDFSNYQTEGGANYDANTVNFNISNITVNDSDGDGYMSKEETVEVVCEVSNLNESNTEADISIGNPGDSKFTYSPSVKATIDGGKSIRYTAKVYCKKLPTGDAIDIPITVSSPSLGSVTKYVTIRMKK